MPFADNSRQTRDGEVVDEGEAFVEKVRAADAVLGVAGPFRVLLQNPRFQPWPVLLADPGQFEFGFANHAHVSRDWCGRLASR